MTPKQTLSSSLTWLEFSLGVVPVNTRVISALDTASVPKYAVP